MGLIIIIPWLPTNIVVGISIGNGVLNTHAPFDIKCIWYNNLLFEYCCNFHHYQTINFTSIVKDSNCVNCKSCSFLPFCIFSHSFSTKKFWNSKSYSCFFKPIIIIDTLALYFSKEVGSKVMFKSLYLIGTQKPLIKLYWYFFITLTSCICPSTLT